MDCVLEQLQHQNNLIIALTDKVHYLQQQIAALTCLSRDSIVSERKNVAKSSECPSSDGVVSDPEPHLPSYFCGTTVFGKDEIPRIAVVKSDQPQKASVSVPIKQIKKCSWCRVPNHTMQNCRRRFNLCFRCGSSQHFLNDCPCPPGYRSSTGNSSVRRHGSGRPKNKSQSPKFGPDMSKVNPSKGPSKSFGKPVSVQRKFNKLNIGKSPDKNHDSSQHGNAIENVALSDNKWSLISQGGSGLHWDNTGMESYVNILNHPIPHQLTWPHSSDYEPLEEYKKSEMAGNPHLSIPEPLAEFTKPCDLASETCVLVDKQSAKSVKPEEPTQSERPASSDSRGPEKPEIVEKLPTVTAETCVLEDPCSTESVKHISLYDSFFERTDHTPENHLSEFMAGGDNAAISPPVPEVPELNSSIKEEAITISPLSRLETSIHQTEDIKKLLEESKLINTPHDLPSCSVRHCKQKANLKCAVCYVTYLEKSYFCSHECYDAEFVEHRETHHKVNPCECEQHECDICFNRNQRFSDMLNLLKDQEQQGLIGAVAGGLFV